MKKTIFLLLAISFLASSVCLASQAAVIESHYNGDSEKLYYTSNPSLQSAYCWTDLTYKVYDTGTRTVKADCWITYKNSYPNHFHNCVELRSFTTNNSYTDSDYSNTATNVVATRNVGSNFTWCYANHGVNTCGRVNLPVHTTGHDSGSDDVVLFTTIRVN